MQITSKKKIMIFSSYFLPGYRAGGPIKSIKNLCSALNKKYEFYILTRDYDVSPSKKYIIDRNIWIKQDYFNIKYLSSFFLSSFKFARDIENIKPDLIYINSFLDIFLYIHLIIYFSLFPQKRVPMIIAPRGEFSLGAKKIKYIRKKLFINFVNFFGIYSNINFHATSQNEKKLIIESLRDFADVFVADNIPTFRETVIKNKDDYDSNLNICFISRISKMKNLLFVIDTLSRIDLKISLDIYGPIEDDQYWLACRDRIKVLNDNISVSYKGSIISQHVYQTLRMYDLLFVPSLGENFGHIFLEALEAGTPILTSDQTPWTWVNDSFAGGAFPLSSQNEYINFISNLNSIENRYLYHLSSLKAYNYFKDNNKSIINTSILFDKVLKASKRENIRKSM
jgi:glycosyltransferase involved in cell wall biosynthesis